MSALQNQLSEKEKELRLARKIAREVIERKNKSGVRGEKASNKKGTPRIKMGALKDNAENSSVKLKDVHDEKMSSISASIADIQTALPDMRQMKTDFNSPNLHTGKILITVKDMNFGYGPDRLWREPLNLQILSPMQTLNMYISTRSIRSYNLICLFLSNWSDITCLANLNMS